MALTIMAHECFYEGLMYTLGLCREIVRVKCGTNQMVNQHVNARGAVSADQALLFLKPWGALPPDGLFWFLV